MTFLSQIWQGFWRHWRLFIIVFVVLTVSGLINYRPNLIVYRSEVRFLIAQSPLETTAEKEEERYYNWVASEYIVYGVKDYVEGTRFAEQVSLELADMGYDDLDTKRVDDIVSSAAIRSRLIVAVADTDEQVVRDVSAVVLNLLSNPAVVEQLEIPQLESAAAQISPIDTDLYFQKLDLRRDAIMGIFPRVLTALAVALIAVTIVELLDPTIRTRRGIDIIGIPVIAEIPSSE